MLHIQPKEFDSSNLLTDQGEVARALTVKVGQGKNCTYCSVENFQPDEIEKK